MEKPEKPVVSVKMLRGEFKLPRYAYKGDAGVDLCANETVTLGSFERALIGTSFALAIPEGYAGLVLPRSGLATRHGVTVMNAPGLIDSSYRGELKVSLVNLDPTETFTVHEGDRIAQLVIVAVPEVEFLQEEVLDETQRGSRGFGSSGV